MSDPTLFVPASLADSEKQCYAMMEISNVSSGRGWG